MRNRKIINLQRASTNWRNSLDETGTGRKAKAMLRRSHSPVSAFGIAAVHDLHVATRNAGFEYNTEGSYSRLALVAIALAHLDNTHFQNITELWRGTDTSPKLSDIRFQAIIRLSNPNELIRPMTRAIAVIKREANMGNLASDLFFWSESVRLRWCFEYYGAVDSTKQELEETNL